MPEESEVLQAGVRNLIGISGRQTWFICMCREGFSALADLVIATSKQNEVMDLATQQEGQQQQ